MTANLYEYYDTLHQRLNGRCTELVLIHDVLCVCGGGGGGGGAEVFV